MKIKLSPTAIACFKKCPTEYRLRYVEGIVPIEDADALRVGTAWHEMQERYQNALAEHMVPEAAFEAVIAWLNETYAEIPNTKTEQEWLEERTVLATLFAGYHWHYGDDPFETIATEQRYDLPLIHPRTGMPLPESDVQRVGKIDRIVRWNGRILVNEYKTTSRNLDGDSDYWNQWRKDSQFSSYVDAVRTIQGDVGPSELCQGVLLDVTKKPTISMKKLSQKDTAALIETGEYFGTKFEVALNDEPDGDMADVAWVDGVRTDVEWGKSGNPAIRETPEMFGARLLADIYETPDKYFVRREVPRTDKDIDDYQQEVYAIYRCIRTMIETGYWYRNERASEPGYKSDYAQIMDQYDVEELCKSGETPDGFKRLWEPKHAATATA